MNPYELGAKQLVISFDATSDFYKKQSGSYGDAKRYDQKADFAAKKASFESQQQAKKIRQLNQKRQKLSSRRGGMDVMQQNVTQAPKMKVKKPKMPKSFGSKALKYLRKNKLGLGLSAAAGLGGAYALS